MVVLSWPRLLLCVDNDTDGGYNFLVVCFWSAIRRQQRNSS